MVLAFVSLVQPLLTPFAPDLAGWAPNHGHVYANGEVVPHTHPWDREPADPLTRDDVPAGFIFHLCEIHPDGLVPVSGSTDEGPAAEETTDSASEEDVVFLFDLNLTGSVLPAPGAPELGCHGASFAARVAVPLAPAGIDTSPTAPPPRA